MRSVARALEPEMPQLQGQALLQIPGRDAGGIEPLHQPQGLLDEFHGPGAHFCDLAHRRREVAVVGEIPDNGGADRADGRVVGLQGELPVEVIGQRGGGRQRVLNRRQLLDFTRHARAVALVHVVVEVVLVVVVFPVVGLAFGRFLGVLLVGLVGGGLRLGSLQVFRGHLFQQRVLDDLLVQHVGELQRRHRQQLDGLLQRRRQDQLLRQLRLELLVDGHGFRGRVRGRSPTPRF